MAEEEKKEETPAEAPKTEEAKLEEVKPAEGETKPAEAAPAEAPKEEAKQEEKPAETPTTTDATPPATDAAATPAASQDQYIEATDLKNAINDMVAQQKKMASLKWTFVRGILYGFGFTIGSVLLVALFVYILSLFDTAPIVGEYAKKIVDIIRQSQ